MTRESLFQIILKCHERLGHSGREKTWSEVQANYSWIRYDTISLYLKSCSQCSLRKPLKNRHCGKPIISIGFLSRVQIYLIDMEDIVETEMIIPEGPQIKEDVVETEMIIQKVSQIHGEPNSGVSLCNLSQLDSLSNISLFFRRGSMGGAALVRI